MNNKDFIHDVDEQEIDIMLKYLPEYSSQNARNIKDKFMQKAGRKAVKISFKKWVLIGAAACMLSVTALAYTGIIDISRIYQKVFGEKAAYMERHIEPLGNINGITPVQESATKDKSGDLAAGNTPVSIQSEQDGIVFKLISAINNEDALRIFATVTDTKGNRLDESLDFTSWGLNQGYGGNIDVIDYDNETKTATLMITSLGNDHRGNATLTIHGFSTGRELIEDLPERHIDIGTLLRGHTPKLISQDLVWKSGGGGDRTLYEESALLKTDEMRIPFKNVDMFSISNIGFVDGILHLQAKAMLRDAYLLDGHYLEVNFVNAENEIVHEAAARIDFITDKKYAYERYSKEPHDAYLEMIYDGITDPAQLDGLSLTIGYMKSAQTQEGHWEFSFKVPEKTTTDFSVDTNLTINGEKTKINKISLSPLGISVLLSQNMSNTYRHQDAVYVEYADGTTIALNESSIQTYEDESTLVFGGNIIENEHVRAIIINGERITVSP